MTKKLDGLHLGYELGTGKPVSIPLRHMVVTGQSQEAGKTTTLEALIDRAGLPAIAFVTKRGEKAFAGARRVAPYFRERADWQFVASVLEAAMRERLKFERAWIMRASKGAQTLADVQRNVRELMKKAKGLSGDVYLTLDEYLEIVVPRVAAVDFAPSLELVPGLNVLDLSDRETFPPELQSLVMRSSLEWVYERCKGTITIIPEAWEFLPQGRGSPVKLSAVELIRKGAGLRNYVWLDSQDIGGVDKELLRSCPVWLLGVQRERNEIKRVLDNIPAGVAKPKAADVMTLSIGQFFACHGNTVAKVYVQPAWMPGDVAQEIARGDRSADDVERPIVKNVNPPIVTKPSKPVPEKSPMSLERLEKKFDQLIDVLGRGDLGRELVRETPPANRSSVAFSGDEEDLYQRIKERLIDEAPHVLKLISTRPEITVAAEVVQIEMNSASLGGRVATILYHGFFKSPKKHKDVRRELERTGTRINVGNLSRELKRFVQLGFLTNEADGFVAVPEMKVNIVKTK